MLDETLKTQLSGYLIHLRQPIDLIASLDQSPAAHEMRTLLQEIAQLSSLIHVREDGQAERRPSFIIAKQGQTRGVCFAAIPLGHELTSLVLALLWTSGHPPKVDAAVQAQLAALEGSYRFEVFMSLSCHSCPDVVQAISLLTVLNPNVECTMIDGALFTEEVEHRHIMAVPSTFLNGERFYDGRMTAEELLTRLDSKAQARSLHELHERAPYDVLIVGAGPAGASAAVYAARKGIRVGLLAERMGGQVNDTLSIENFTSVLETDGPRFAAALEAQVKQNGVEIITGFAAKQLIPASTESPYHRLLITDEIELHAKSVILATGARWRNINAPGEQTYKNKGVAYCPHCDGPLFKGKRVAVIGGGNSGIEAAIDLAGITQHVTVLEFADQLKADAVLLKKLNSLPNVTVHTQAQTTEIVGDGHKVTAIRWLDRATQQPHETLLQGVFVQIGLVPNTEWLKGTLNLTRFGEIEINERTQTNLTGIYAAGDCTTVPYKQIIVAAGEGAKAALSAFDGLIRQV